MTLNVTVPKGWHELTQEQLRFLLRTMIEVQLANRHTGFRSLEDAQAQERAQVNTLCFFKWSGLKMICPYDNGWLVLHGGTELHLSTEQVTAAITHLVWSKDIPQMPVRLDTVDGAKAVRADLAEGFPFDKWLSCEALWQGYLATSNEECLRRMAAILYDKADIVTDPAETLGVFYWWAAVKNMVTMMFPNFFHPAPGSEGPTEPNRNDIRRNMDAQIRALTKGDITKERIILSIETMRALTELDALAREYDELNKKYPKK